MYTDSTTCILLHGCHEIVGFSVVGVERVVDSGYRWVDRDTDRLSRAYISNYFLKTESRRNFSSNLLAT